MMLQQASCCRTSTAFRHVQHISFEEKVTDNGLSTATEAIDRLPEAAQISLHAPALTDMGLNKLSESNVYSLFG